MTELSPRAQRLQAELRKAHTYEDTVVALSMVDTPTLREIEAQLLGFPVDASVLIERLAEAHMAQQRGKQARNTGQVTPEVVHGWAVSTLIEWLTGVSDFDPSIGGQYAVTATDAGTGAVHIDVSTPDGKNTRRFTVEITVTSVELGVHRWAALQRILNQENAA